MRAKEVVRKMFEDIKSNWYLPVTEWQVYSEGEQKIGVWTDGKPLYRKTVQVEYQPTTTSGTQTHKMIPFSDFGITDVDINSFKRIYGTLLDTKLPAQIPDLVFSSGGTNQFITARPAVNGSVLVLFLRSSLDPTTVTNWSALITLEYTKTTDTAATTPKVPFEPLHEWSTEERHVGYWIDGSPVYEKTVECGALPNNTTKNVSTGLSNVRIVNYQCIAYRPIDGATFSLPIAQQVDQLTMCSIRENGESIRFAVMADMSAFTESYVTLRYTKTT